jgi:hypothetical protein
VLALGRKVPRLIWIERAGAEWKPERRAGRFDRRKNVGPLGHEEGVMSIYQKVCRSLLVAVAGLAAIVSLASARATDLNPAALQLQLPNQIKWVDDMKRGESTAVLAGDPEKPGLYVELVKWHAHHMSHPHFHPNDRFITVISGTWWVGTGTKFEPDGTVPLPPGSFVKHVGKQVHYDGAKDEDVTLEIVGEGPATSTPAEVK